MKEDQGKVHEAVLSSIKMLCSTNLTFHTKLLIEGVIGVTRDHGDLFIVHVNEQVMTDCRNASSNSIDMNRDLKPNQMHVHDALMSSIKMLCSTGLSFDLALLIEGVIGITQDDNCPFLVHINEHISGDRPRKKQKRRSRHGAAANMPEDVASAANSERKKRMRRHRMSPDEGVRRKTKKKKCGMLGAVCREDSPRGDGRLELARLPLEESDVDSISGGEHELYESEAGSVKRRRQSNQFGDSLTGYTYICRIGGCGKSYSGYSSICHHRRSFHKLTSGRKGLNLRGTCSQMYDIVDAAGNYVRKHTGVGQPEGDSLPGAKARSRAKRGTVGSHINRIYQCIIDGCRKRYQSYSSLATHRRTRHKITSGACGIHIRSTDKTYRILERGVHEEFDEDFASQSNLEESAEFYDDSDDSRREETVRAAAGFFQSSPSSAKTSPNVETPSRKQSNVGDCGFPQVGALHRIGDAAGHRPSSLLNDELPPPQENDFGDFDDDDVDIPQMGTSYVHGIRDFDAPSDADESSIVEEQVLQDEITF